MNDAALIVAVLVIAIGGIVGFAYLLDRRRIARGPVGPELPPIGPLGRAFLWIRRVLVALMVLSLVGFFALREMALAWVALGCLLAYVVLNRVDSVIRVIGK